MEDPLFLNLGDWEMLGSRRPVSRPGLRAQRPSLRRRVAFAHTRHLAGEQHETDGANAAERRELRKR